MFECEYCNENGSYRFFVIGTLLRTPTGNPVETRSKPRDYRKHATGV